MFVCMFVCMCVCLIVCMFVCMHVCVYIYIYTHTHLYICTCIYRYQDRLIAEKCAPTDHIEVLLDTYAHQYSAQAHRLEIVSKQIEATEDLLNLRLESIQKNTFVANALFHMILTFLGIPTVMPYPKPHSQAEPASAPRACSFVSAAHPPTS